LIRRERKRRKWNKNIGRGIQRRVNLKREKGGDYQMEERKEREKTNNKRKKKKEGTGKRKNPQ
jgi:hypothetical protein